MDFVTSEWEQQEAFDKALDNINLDETNSNLSEYDLSFLNRNLRPRGDSGDSLDRACKLMLDEVPELDEVHESPSASPVPSSPKESESFSASSVLLDTPSPIKQLPRLKRKFKRAPMAIKFATKKKRKFKRAPMGVKFNTYSSEDVNDVEEVCNEAVKMNTQQRSKKALEVTDDIIRKCMEEYIDPKEITDHLKSQLDMRWLGCHNSCGRRRHGEDEEEIKKKFETEIKDGDKRKCPWCTNVLCNSQKFKHHVYRLHGDKEDFNPNKLDLKPFKCGFCEEDGERKGFVEHNDWRRHLRNSHKIELAQIEHENKKGKLETKYMYYLPNHPIYLNQDSEDDSN